MPELNDQRPRLENEFGVRLTAAIDRHAPDIIRGLAADAPTALQDTANDLWQPFARTLGDEAYWPLVLAYLSSWDNLDNEFGRPLGGDGDRVDYSIQPTRPGGRVLQPPRGLTLPQASISTQRAADAFAGQRSEELADSIIGSTAARLEITRRRFGVLPTLPPVSPSLPPAGAPGAPTPGDSPLDWDREFRDILGPARVERIAISETTDSISAGESGLVGRIRAELGWTVKAIWRTERDAKVCPICREFDGTDEDYFLARVGYPPAHPSCRCWLEWSVVRKPELSAV